MGNKVSAEAGSNAPVGLNNSIPPPECPMHNKADENEIKKTKTPSECPIQHDDKDINPYNMVRFISVMLP